VATGLYHYSLEHHTLEEMKTLSESEAEQLAVTFTADQRFTATAAVLFIMTARFRRTFWKYANHAKAYRVLLLDVGHLSQTLYLVCTELGVGAFFTSAVCETDIEEALGLDEAEEGAIGICGCGVLDPAPPMQPFVHDAYRVPRT
jgi:SagB-type dehydrogenase family enzyme